MSVKAKEATKRWTLTKGHGELEDVEGCDEVFRRVIPESGLVLIRVTVKGGLRRMFWKFRPGDGFDVWLDSYWAHERKNKADKWTETSHYATANAEAATLQPSAVPMPDWMWDLATMTIRMEIHERGVKREADRVVRQKVKRENYRKSTKRVS